MSRFAYLRDPLFLLAGSGYALNRWLLKPSFPSPFLRGHFNDLLLIPAALPLVLWIQRRFGLRTHDHFPSPMEIAFHWMVWSAVCEWIGPRVWCLGTADLWDVVAYGLGGVAAGYVWWHRCRGWRSSGPPE